MANLDPLGINNADLDSTIPDELIPAHWGLCKYISIDMFVQLIWMVIRCACFYPVAESC